MTRDPEVMVLLSGGVDSTACVDFYLDFGRPVCSLFVDYGQPSAAAEREASTRIAEHFAISHHCCSWSGPQTRAAGLMPGRNLFLLAASLFEKPPSVTAIALGVHSGTDYADCSPAFVEAAREMVRAAGFADCDVAAPFIEWMKQEVYEYARRRTLPVSLTYSCEAANAPCQHCMSCLDRKYL